MAAERNETRTIRNCAGGERAGGEGGIPRWSERTESEPAEFRGGTEAPFCFWCFAVLLFLFLSFMQDLASVFLPTRSRSSAGCCLLLASDAGEPSPGSVRLNATRCGDAGPTPPEFVRPWA